MKDSAKATIGSCLTWVTTIAQTNEIFQLIQIILASIVSVITIAFIIYKWWKSATADGKITKEEIDDLFDKIDDEINKENKK